MRHLALILAIGAVLPATAGAARAPSDVLLGSLTIPFASKENHPVTGVTFVKDKQYTFEISGTGLATYAADSNDACRASPGQPCVLRKDAFYCYDSTRMEQCSGDKTFQQPGITMDRGWAGWFGSPTPSYNPKHEYSTTGPFFGGSQEIAFKSFFGSIGNCDEPEENEPACSGEFLIEVWGPKPGGGDDEEDPCAAARAGSRAMAAQSCPAPLKIVAANVTDEVSIRSRNGEWRDLTDGTELNEGDEIHTGATSSVLMKFSDGTTVQVNELTQIKLSAFVNRSNRIKMEMLLRIGDMKAKIGPQTAAITDFSIRTPTATCSVRGTVFSTFYDPVGKATIVSTEEGEVSVDPTAKGLPTTSVPAGKELEVTPKRLSKLSGRGRAGARGGVNRKKARTLVLARIDRAVKACSLTTPRSRSAVGVKPAPKGWLVSVKTSGKAKGKSVWRVKGGKARPKNKLAKKISRGCR